MNLYATLFYISLCFFSFSGSAVALELKSELTVACYAPETSTIIAGEAVAKNVLVQGGSNTSISFQLEEDAYVVLKLFDPLGNLLTVLVNGQMRAGKHHVSIAAHKLKPGIYFYNLLIDGAGETRKLTIKE